MTHFDKTAQDIIKQFNLTVGKPELLAKRIAAELELSWFRGRIDGAKQMGKSVKKLMNEEFNK